MLQSMTDSHAQDLQDTLATEMPLPEGRFWRVSPRDGLPPGWFTAVGCDSEGRVVRGGYVLLCGPGGRRLRLPGSWPPAEARILEVVTELADSGLSDEELVQRICHPPSDD